MNEENIYTEETVTEEVVVEEQPVAEAVAEPAKAKKGFATAALVFGILAFITTLFFLNYIFGILALIFGIIYLAKKADVKPKGKAIAGDVLASLSLIISTTLWVGVYIYLTQTNITDIIGDVSSIITGEKVDGEEVVNQMISDAIGDVAEMEAVKEVFGGEINMDTIEEFVGGEVTVDRVVDFVGDVKPEEIEQFVSEVQTMDSTVLENIANDFEGEISYEKLEEKLGEDFTLTDIMDYIKEYNIEVPQQ